MKQRFGYLAVPLLTPVAMNQSFARRQPPISVTYRVILDEFNPNFLHSGERSMFKPAEVKTRGESIHRESR